VERRALLGGTLALLAAPRAAAAPPSDKVYRVGLLSTLSPESSVQSRLWDSFYQRLRELGYVKDRNLIVEDRHGQPDKLPALAAELVRLRVDVIVASGSLTPYAAKSATTTIPVVITNHGDPVGGGLVASLGRPGGNITGLSLLNPELIGKQLELLKEAVSRPVRMVSVIWNPTSQIHPRMLNDADVSARVLQLRLERVSARGRDEYDRAFGTLARTHPDAVFVLGDPIFWNQRSRIVELLTTRYRLPAMFNRREYVEVGGFMSYGANLVDSYRQAATYVDKILNGAKPGDLPVEQPTKFELVINLKTAKALGLTIPPSLLQRADQVIE